MIRQKDTFVLRCDFFPQIKMLGRDQRGDLLMAIFAYSSEEPMPEMDDMTRMCFGFIKASLDANSVRYQAICERNKENGSRGGRPPSESRSTPTESRSTPTESRSTPPESRSNPTDNPKTERLIRKPAAPSGKSPKPRQSPANPVVFEAEFDSDCEFEKESVSEEGREREQFLKMLLFEKKLLNPQLELDRFEAHYAKTGWVDAHGNPIRDKAAALLWWKPDKEAPKLPEATLRIWKELFEALDEDDDRRSMLVHFCGFQLDAKTLYITMSDKALGDFLEEAQPVGRVQSVLMKHFKYEELKYRVLRR